MSKEHLINKSLIGKKFLRKHRFNGIETVVDIYVTRNLKNEVVDVTYVSEYMHCNQRMRDINIPQATIKRNEIKDDDLVIF